MPNTLHTKQAVPRTSLHSKMGGPKYSMHLKFKPIGGPSAEGLARVAIPMPVKRQIVLDESEAMGPSLAKEMRM